MVQMKLPKGVNLIKTGISEFVDLTQIFDQSKDYLKTKAPPSDENGIRVWRNNKASAAADAFRWQFAIKNDVGVFTFFIFFSQKRRK